MCCRTGKHTNHLSAQKFVRTDCSGSIRCQYIPDHTRLVNCVKRESADLRSTSSSLDYRKAFLDVVCIGVSNLNCVTHIAY
jgi:hypothetical protein